MKRSKMIKELENYKYDYEYFVERFKNAKEFKAIIDVLTEKTEKIKDMDISVPTDKISLELKEIAKEQDNEENALLDMIKQKHAVEERIDKLQQPYKTVLLYRYVSLYSFGEIAKKMNYSTKRIYQLHQKGVEMYIEKYSNNIV